MNDGLLQAASAAALHRLNLERFSDVLHGVSDAPNSEARLEREAVVADRGGREKGGYLDGVVMVNGTLSGRSDGMRLSLSHRSLDAQRASTREG